MSLKILGMGNAVLDIVTSVSDDFLKSQKIFLRDQCHWLIKSYQMMP